MTGEIANHIYNVLERVCGAHPLDRQNFVSCAVAYYISYSEHHTLEYRFQGDLGFGGKIYIEPGRWRVDYYPEDETAKRLAKKILANHRLSGLREELLI